MTPTPDQIRVARRLAHLTQAQAAALVHSHGNRWSEWERGIYAMHPGLWELFTLKLANRVGIEPTAFGFGDRRSA